MLHFFGVKNAWWCHASGQAGHYKRVPRCATVAIVENRFSIQIVTDEGQSFATIWGVQQAHEFVAECKRQVANGDILSRGAYHISAEHVHQIRARDSRSIARSNL